MVCGKLPYGDDLEDPIDIYNEIQINKELTFPQFYKDREGKEMIRRLLTKNADSRSIDSFKVLKNMDYLKEFNWKDVSNKNIKTPYKPKQKPIQGKQFQNCNAKPFLKMQGAKIKKNIKPNIPNWD